MTNSSAVNDGDDPYVPASNTCPRWCRTEHGELDGEENHLHTGASLRLADGVTAYLCATIDPYTGATDGPYILVESEEWSLDRARSIGQALIALADSGTPPGQTEPHLAESGGATWGHA